MYIIASSFSSDAEMQYKKALKNGSVEICIHKCLVLGMAGVGKTHFKHLLLNLPIQDSIISTGVSEHPIQALVGPLNSSLFSYLQPENESDGSWNVVDKEQLMSIVAGAIRIDPNLDPVPPTTEELSSQSSDHTLELPESLKLVCNTSMAREDTDRVLINAFKNPKKGDYKIRLVHFIDSGGQPEFLELLPAFVQDISTAFLTLKLSKHFDHCPQIPYRDHDGKSVRKHTSRSQTSHKQVFEQCLRIFQMRKVHPNIFVIGTHRDKVGPLKMQEDKDSQICKMVNEEYLKRKTVEKVIWDFNTKDPNDYDRENAKVLRISVVDSLNTFFHLPLKWFGLELQITRYASNGVMSFDECLRHAKLFEIDENGLRAALQHMNKFNLFLWYYDVPALEKLVFSDPQIILATITALVKSKYQLRKSPAPEMWLLKFCKYGYVCNELLSHTNFKDRFNDIFTSKYFIDLMFHLSFLAPIEDGYYLMPAILDPLPYGKVLKRCDEYNSVEPLLLSFTTTKCIPYGIFTNLVAFMIKYNHGTLNMVKDKIPTCLYRNCVSFQYKYRPATFTLVDSFSCIQIYVKSDDPVHVCPELKHNILIGIKQCADALKYNDIIIQEGFICHECYRKGKSLCNPCFPYEQDPAMAKCAICSSVRDISKCREIWQLGSSKRMSSKSLKMRLCLHG